MNQRYEPTRRSSRVAAALAAVLTVLVLFDSVAGLADARSSADARAQTASRPALPPHKA